MKRTLIAIVCAAFLGAGASALAADAGAPKADCAEKQKALDDANAAVKTAGAPDLSSCKDKKAKEKTDCEKPLKEKGEGRRQGRQGQGQGSQDGARLLQEPEEEGLQPVDRARPAGFRARHFHSRTRRSIRSLPLHLTRNGIFTDATVA